MAPNGVPEEQLVRQQWHVLGKRQGDTPQVEVEHTMLTDVELQLLQTFPKYWFVVGTRMERAFQIGNAVPVALAGAVGMQILKSIEQKGSKVANAAY
jgi:DNA (cytosine-5)-methyltransferase 1